MCFDSILNVQLDNGNHSTELYVFMQINIVKGSVCRVSDVFLLKERFGWWGGGRAESHLKVVGMPVVLFKGASCGFVVFLRVLMIERQLMFLPVNLSFRYAREEVKSTVILCCHEILNSQGLLIFIKAGL